MKFAPRSEQKSLAFRSRLLLKHPLIKERGNLNRFEKIFQVRGVVDGRLFSRVSAPQHVESARRNCTTRGHAEVLARQSTGRSSGWRLLFCEAEGIRAHKTRWLSRSEEGWKRAD